MRKLLIVDDNTDLCAMMALVLRGQYDVRTCSSLPELEDALGVFTPDVVLLDRYMHEHQAEHLLVVLARRVDLGRVPVLLTTGSADAREEAERLKCAGHLTKPFTNAQLKEALERVLAPPAR